MSRCLENVETNQCQLVNIIKSFFIHFARIIFGKVRNFASRAYSFTLHNFAYACAFCCVLVSERL